MATLGDLCNLTRRRCDVWMDIEIDRDINEMGHDK